MKYRTLKKLRVLKLARKEAARRLKIMNWMIFVLCLIIIFVGLTNG
jgi:t-SNARE complex subunit (syntaxin)|tara:strand:- start:601 stop:738 length:138 start_codon:yes stop_codon:yes gene_type:complete